MRASLLLCLALVPACGMATTASDAGPGQDATSTRDGGAPNDAGSPGDAGVVCSGHDATSFPSFDRACTLDSDCIVAAHLADCCGTLDALGIARSEATRFAAAEAQCESQYPACGCDSGTVRTDDGSSPPPGTGTSAVVVDCIAGTCTSRARASTPCDGAVCAPTQVCVMECSGVPLDGGTLPSRCVDVAPGCESTSDCSCFGSTDPCPTGTCVTVDHGAPVCMCA